MSTNIKISVLIPIYNSNKKTRQLSLNSLFNQTLKELEFIFINDACIDDTMQFIEEKAREDKRIKIINNPHNLGVGSSRNNGIKASLGEYIANFDIDDFIQHDFYEKLYEKTLKNKYDIVKGSRITVENNNKNFSQFNDEVRMRLQSQDLFPFYYEHTTAIYNRDFIINNKIEHGTSSRGSDTTFLYHVCTCNPSITFVDDVFYFYMINQNSLTRTKSIGYYQGYLSMIKEIVLHTEKIKTVDNELKCQEVLNRLIKNEMNKILSSNNQDLELQDILNNYIVLLKKYKISLN